MKETRIMMGMPITVEIADVGSKERHRQEINKVFDYFRSVDERFSTYKDQSEISKINRGEIPESAWSSDMKLVFTLCKQTEQETAGYFSIRNRKGIYDPSGIVKGWAIQKAAELLLADGYTHFYVDAGGDIQTSGLNGEGAKWRVGIRNPFNQKEIIKILEISGCGVATSGTYIRGQHIYNPKNMQEEITDIVSLTVVGPNVYEADRFATAAFAMGRKGIEFIEGLSGLEGYLIDKEGVATMTSGFERFVLSA